MLYWLCLVSFCAVLIHWLIRLEFFLLFEEGLRFDRELDVISGIKHWCMVDCNYCCCACCSACNLFVGECHQCSLRCACRCPVAISVMSLSDVSPLSTLHCANYSHKDVLPASLDSWRPCQVKLHCMWIWHSCDLLSEVIDSFKQLYFMQISYLMLKALKALV